VQIGEAPGPADSIKDPERKLRKKIQNKLTRCLIRNPEIYRELTTWKMQISACGNSRNPVALPSDVTGNALACDDIVKGFEHKKLTAVTEEGYLSS
jgi:hypothetical protein